MLLTYSSQKNRPNKGLRWLARRYWVELLSNLLLIVSFGVIICPPGTVAGLCIYILKYNLEYDFNRCIKSFATFEVYTWPFWAFLLAITTCLFFRYSIVRSLLGAASVIGFVAYNIALLRNMYTSYHPDIVSFWITLATSVPFYIFSALKITQLVMALGRERIKGDRNRNGY